MTFDVIVQKQSDNNFIARPALWPDSSASGKSQQDALMRVRILIRELLTQTQLVKVDVDLPESDENNPWVTKAGVFADDPTWDDFVDSMAAYRNEVDEAVENSQ